MKQAQPSYRTKRNVYRSSLPIVEREKARKRLKKVTKVIGLTIAFFLAIAFVGNIVTIGMLAKNLVVAYTSASRVESGRINIVVDFGQVAVVSFDRINHTIAVVSLPKDVYVSSDTGSYRLSAVYQAAELKGAGQGGKALTAAASDLFGLPIDGYVKFQSAYPAVSVEDVRKDLSRVEVLIGLFRTNNYAKMVATNLSTTDAVKLWRENKRVRFDKVHILVLDDQNQFNQTELADGSRVLGVSDGTIDRVTRDLFTDPQIVNSNQSVAIINASHINGLGGSYARMITRLGARVVRVETADTKQQQSEILYRQDKPDLLAKRLSRTRQFTIMKRQDDTSAELGDITIILGD